MDIEIKEEINNKKTVNNLSDIKYDSDNYDDYDEIEYNNDNVEQILPKNNNDNEVKKITPEFQTQVIEWVNLDDQIKKKRKEVKILNDKKKKMEEYIIQHMFSINEEVIQISDGKLRRNTSKTKSALKHELIHNALTSYLNNTHQAFEITKHILDSVPFVERTKLKRTSLRKTK